MVVTDMTERGGRRNCCRRPDESCGAGAGAERGRVALELPRPITRCFAPPGPQPALADKLPWRAKKPRKKEAVKLRELLGEAARKWSASRAICGQRIGSSGLVAGCN